jgi:hypothetical protein
VLVFTVLTEQRPLRYWLVCGICGRRWELQPDRRLLPQTREVFAEHQLCVPREAADAG